MNVAPPPRQVSNLHQDIVEELRSLCAKQGSELTQSLDAPAVVTVVNGSRVVSDIRRDLGRCQGMW